MREADVQIVCIPEKAKAEFPRSTSLAIRKAWHRFSWSDLDHPGSVPNILLREFIAQGSRIYILICEDDPEEFVNWVLELLDKQDPQVVIRCSRNSRFKDIIGEKIESRSRISE